MPFQCNKSISKARITKKLKRKWNAREKLRIITYYEQNQPELSIKETCRNFSIQPNQLRDWIKKKDKLIKASPKTFKLHNGHLPHYQQIEEILFEWITNQRQLQNSVTREMIIAKAVSLTQTTNFQNQPNLQSFKFSSIWLNGFLSRYKLSIRRRTTIAQRLPEDLEEKKQNFLSYVLSLRIRYNYPLFLIGNMDETPLTFDSPNPSTIEKRGTHTISIRTTGNEKKNFTVILACLADGTKLPPVCIFKRKTLPQENFPHNVIVRANEKGWVNENEMLWWIENIWSKRAPNNPRSLLILDSFRAHLVDPVKQRLLTHHTNMAVIPGGLTSKLQPLDVSINKSFKAKIRVFYNHWMSETIHDLTPSGRIKRPSYSQLALWVVVAWESLDPDLIRRSFGCCNI